MTSGSCCADHVGIEQAFLYFTVGCSMYFVVVNKCMCAHTHRTHLHIVPQQPSKQLHLLRILLLVTILHQPSQVPQQAGGQGLQLLPCQAGNCCVDCRHVTLVENLKGGYEGATDSTARGNLQTGESQHKERGYREAAVRRVLTERCQTLLGLCGEQRKRD